MTTGIEVVINEYDSILHIPLESIFKDSVSYVFKKEGRDVVRQEVVVGPSNDLSIIIAGGLNKGEDVLLNKPEGAEDLKFVYFDQEKKKEILADLERQENQRKEVLKEKKKSVKDDLELKAESGNSFIIFN